MKNFLFLLWVSIAPFATFGQDLNAYKYVVVPAEFDFLKEPNQFELNKLTKFLFEKYGFETYMLEEGGELPKKLSDSRCEALYANVIDNSGLFNTKLSVILKDCNNRQVFVSKEGISKEKDYKIAYHNSLREAFKSIEALNYKYSSNDFAELNELENPKGETTPAVVEVVARPEMVSQNSPSNLEELVFTHKNTNYELKKTEKGFNFFQLGMDQPFAALIKSTTGNTFIYSSITASGMANFDIDGNLIVEILQGDSNTLEKTIYLKTP